MGAESRSALYAAIREAIDPAIASAWPQRLDATSAPLPVPPSAKRVLVGHRAAGKTRLLPLLAQWLPGPAYDLDAEVERREARPLRALFEASPTAFRAAERAAFMALAPQTWVAAGGGFLSHHQDLLVGHLAVLVPLTFETFRERLLSDTQRPRLTKLPLELELQAVWAEREQAHARVPTVPLLEFLRRT